MAVLYSSYGHDGADVSARTDASGRYSVLRHSIRSWVSAAGMYAGR